MERLEQQLKSLLREVAIDLLSSTEKKGIATIRRLAIDARLDVRDYTLSQTREEQVECAAVAQKRLNKLQKSILAAGSAFSAADVAQLCAQLEQIGGRII